MKKKNKSKYNIFFIIVVAEDGINISTLNIDKLILISISSREKAIARQRKRRE
jgi:hypothetical protein